MNKKLVALLAAIGVTGIIVAYQFGYSYSTVYDVKYQELVRYRTHMLTGELEVWRHGEYPNVDDGAWVVDDAMYQFNHIVWHSDERMRRHDIERDLFSNKDVNDRNRALFENKQQQ